MGDALVYPARGARALALGVKTWAHRYRLVSEGRRVTSSFVGYDAAGVPALLVNSELDLERLANPPELSELIWQRQGRGEYLATSHRQQSFAGENAMPAPSVGDWRLQAAADFDRDGEDDLVWRHAGTGEAEIWLMAGRTIKQRRPVTPTVSSPSWTIAGSGDFDGDGQPDLLWRNSADGRNTVWLMDGAARRSMVELPQVGAPDFRMRGVGDFDGDGRVDIVWRKDDGRNALWFMDRNPVRRLRATDLPSVSNAWSLAAVADFDEDGNADLLWQSASTGRTVAWLMNGESRKAIVDVTPVRSEGTWQLIGARRRPDWETGRSPPQASHVQQTLSESDPRTLQDEAGRDMPETLCPPTSAASQPKALTAQDSVTARTCRAEFQKAFAETASFPALDSPKSIVDFTLAMRELNCCLGNPDPVISLGESCACWHIFPARPVLKEGPIPQKRVELVPGVAFTTYEHWDQTFSCEPCPPNRPIWDAATKSCQPAAPTPTPTPMPGDWIASVPLPSPAAGTCFELEIKLEQERKFGDGWFEREERYLTQPGEAVSRVGIRLGPQMTEINCEDQPIPFVPWQVHIETARRAGPLGPEGLVTCVQCGESCGGRSPRGAKIRNVRVVVRPFLGRWSDGTTVHVCGAPSPETPLPPPIQVPNPPELDQPSEPEPCPPDQERNQNGLCVCKMPGMIVDPQSNRCVPEARCFGAVGNNCTPLQEDPELSSAIGPFSCGRESRGPVPRRPLLGLPACVSDPHYAVSSDGSQFQAVSVGSLQHDQCCARNPRGAYCGSGAVTGPCLGEFLRAALDVTTPGNTWRERFNPTIAAPPGAVLVNPDGSLGPEGLTLRAPAGTRVRAEAEARNVCESGRGFRDAAGAWRCAPQTPVLPRVLPIPSGIDADPGDGCEQLSVDAAWDYATAPLPVLYPSRNYAESPFLDLPRTDDDALVPGWIVAALARRKQEQTTYVDRPLELEPNDVWVHRAPTGTIDAVALLRAGLRVSRQGVTELHAVFGDSDAAAGEMVDCVVRRLGRTVKGASLAGRAAFEARASAISAPPATFAETAPTPGTFAEWWEQKRVHWSQLFQTEAEGRDAFSIREARNGRPAASREYIFGDACEYPGSPRSPVNLPFIGKGAHALTLELSDGLVLQLRRPIPVLGDRTWEDASFALRNEALQEVRGEGWPTVPPFVYVAPMPKDTCAVARRFIATSRDGDWDDTNESGMDRALRELDPNRKALAGADLCTMLRMAQSPRVRQVNDFQVALLEDGRVGIFDPGVPGLDAEPETAERGVVRVLESLLLAAGRDPSSCWSPQQGF